MNEELLNQLLKELKQEKIRFALAKFALPFMMGKLCITKYARIEELM